MTTTSPWSTCTTLPASTLVRTPFFKTMHLGDWIFSHCGTRPFLQMDSLWRRRSVNRTSCLMSGPTNCSAAWCWCNSQRTRALLSVKSMSPRLWSITQLSSLFTPCTAALMSCTATMSCLLIWRALAISTTIRAYTSQLMKQCRGNLWMPNTVTCLFDSTFLSGFSVAIGSCMRPLKSTASPSWRSHLQESKHANTKSDITIATERFRTDDLEPGPTVKEETHSGQPEPSVSTTFAVAPIISNTPTPRSNAFCTTFNVFANLRFVYGPACQKNLFPFQ